MHDTALEMADLFFKSYARGDNKRLLDVGSQNVNGSIREVVPSYVEYVGLDFTAGPGVDVVTQDPYELPFESASFDYVVSSSCFEHSEFFWLLFNEIQRVLRSDGICYLNVPSNGSFHQFPVDCWRFYPDSGLALEKWARRSGYRTTMLESYVCYRKDANWNDFVAVFLKDEDYLKCHNDRILDGGLNFYNGYIRDQLGTIKSCNYSKKTEDQKLLHSLKKQLMR